MLTLIPQSLYNSSQQDFHHRHSSHTYLSCISHFWEILQAYDIEGRVQQEKEHKNQGACQALGINWILSKVQKSFWSCTHVNSC